MYDGDTAFIPFPLAIISSYFPWSLFLFLRLFYFCLSVCDVMMIIIMIIFVVIFTFASFFGWIGGFYTHINKKSNILSWFFLFSVYFPFFLSSYFLLFLLLWRWSIFFQFLFPLLLEVKRVCLCLSCIYYTTSTSLFLHFSCEGGKLSVSIPNKRHTAVKSCSLFFTAAAVAKKESFI